MDAGSGFQGDGVRAEGPPGLGGDAGFLAQLASRALIRCLAVLPAAPGQEHVLAAVLGELGGQDGNHAVRVSGHDDGGVAHRPRWDVSVMARERSRLR